MKLTCNVSTAVCTGCAVLWFVTSVVVASTMGTLGFRSCDAQSADVRLLLTQLRRDARTEQTVGTYRFNTSASGLKTSGTRVLALYEDVQGVLDYGKRSYHQTGPFMHPIWLRTAMDGHYFKKFTARPSFVDDGSYYAIQYKAIARSTVDSTTSFDDLTACVSAVLHPNASDALYGLVNRLMIGSIVVRGDTMYIEYHIHARACPAWLETALDTWTH